MWQIRRGAGYLCLLLCIGIVALVPGIAVACEGAITSTWDEGETEATQDFTFAGGDTELDWTQTNSGAEEVDLGTLSLAGRDAALFRILNAGNCNGFRLRPRNGTTCTVTIRLENGTAREAEVVSPGEFLPSRVRGSRRVLLLH